MKKLKLILVTLLSLLLLAACGSKKSSGEVTTDPSTLAKQLAEETVTSDTLSEVEASSAYMSTGASACEAAVIKCSNADYASEVSDLLKQRVSNQKDLYSSYNAGETTKLENAIIKTSGNYVVLCVCDDTSKAEEILKNAGF